jgi:hypothetical protein
MFEIGFKSGGFRLSWKTPVLPSPTAAFSARPLLGPVAEQLETSPNGSELVAGRTRPRVLNQAHLVNDFRCVTVYSPVSALAAGRHASAFLVAGRSRSCPIARELLAVSR